MTKPLLCLDLEGTLISNAVSQIPRPGLYDFLDEVAQLCDLVVYTSVSEERTLAIQKLLVSEVAVPTWFKDLGVIRAGSNLKPKSKCGREDAYLLDDQKAVVAPGEEDWWIPIKEFVPPYSNEDRALAQALKSVESKLAMENQWRQQ